ncbi:hypothetical protein MVES1_000309 [Malassezia vespertilionis]|uniref:Uncharacterized protein n=1 Tax=Malassezia vespertilionis TaxID=2020962 RepID=A0A2N1JH05_9BASI|nr:uncharacterized protein MVES1_000309 [Malassezia vespertilionis]PKI85824.1 hypothetical protein MVES_000290 [Malassezia vespertilionis]WFD04984.1 hypothetical protein MVES1_000309 [Malassezia vespertilionis]
MSTVTYRHRRVTPRTNDVNATVPPPMRVAERSNKLRTLLIIFAITTIALAGFQFLRLRTMRSKRVQIRTAAPPSAMVAQVAQSEKLSPVEPGTEGEVEVQFDETGELDLGTMQRLLDIMYRGPKDPEGYKSVEQDVDAQEGAYRFRKESQQDEHVPLL